MRGGTYYDLETKKRIEEYIQDYAVVDLESDLTIKTIINFNLEANQIK